MTSEPALRAREVTRRFGGLVAVSAVSLDFHVGEIHAVIGPNGAGKSTFINLLAGELPPSAGEILLRGRNVTALPAWRRARAGLGRSFQRTNIFPGFTVRENCRLAAQAVLPSALRFLKPASAYRAIADRAAQALATAGLAARAEIPAAILSHGEQRQLEIAMALASEPAVLLLDEPLAGMGPEEARAMVALLGRLKQGHAIVLVEHDMDAVFALADRISVLVNGELIASGAPEAVRTDPGVRAAYLGDEAA